jgi:hypothetical protein
MFSPYPIDPTLTAIAVAYKNSEYIADAVLPRVRVDKQKFTFITYPVSTFFNIVETKVGRRSAPNQLVMEGTEATDATEDNGLDGVVPNADIDNSDPRYDPLGNQIMLLNESIAIAREARVANIIHNAASYDPALQITLSGTGQFSDFANSDPVSAILGYLDQPFMRPTDYLRNGGNGWRRHARTGHPAI